MKQSKCYRRLAKSYLPNKLQLKPAKHLHSALAETLVIIFLEHACANPTRSIPNISYDNHGDCHFGDVYTS
jgi:hypothetical protein